MIQVHRAGTGEGARRRERECRCIFVRGFREGNRGSWEPCWTVQEYPRAACELLEW